MAPSPNSAARAGRECSMVQHGLLLDCGSAEYTLHRQRRRAAEEISLLAALSLLKILPQQKLA